MPWPRRRRWVSRGPMSRRRSCSITPNVTPTLEPRTGSEGRRPRGGLRLPRRGRSAIRARRHGVALEVASLPCVSTVTTTGKPTSRGFASRATSRSESSVRRRSSAYGRSTPDRLADRAGVLACELGASGRLALDASAASGRSRRLTGARQLAGDFPRLSHGEGAIAVPSTPSLLAAGLASAGCRRYLALRLVGFGATWVSVVSRRCPDLMVDRRLRDRRHVAAADYASHVESVLAVDRNLGRETADRCP